MAQAVLLSTCRTPIGRFQGGLLPMAAPDLGAVAVREAIARAGVEASAVQEVILGNVLQAGLGQNPARIAALRAGVPVEVPAFTVNKVCGSALKAIMLAAQAVKAGDRELVVAGGMESMSNAPHMVLGSRQGLRLGDGRLVDHMVHDGLWDVHNDVHMGETGEIVAERFGITRQAADQFALESHARAHAAQSSGAFAKEIVAVQVPGRKGETTMVQSDEGIRPGGDAAALARLKPAFRTNGIVTAANASQISDGAAAVVVATQEYAEEHGLPVVATIDGYDAAGTRPEWVMEAPILSVRNLMHRLGTTIEDFALVEHNEAFATASCAVRQELGIPADRFNVHGGAVALGHPIGASGARVVATLVHALEARGGGRGLATLCLGGGNAVSLALTV